MLSEEQVNNLWVAQLQHAGQILLDAVKQGYSDDGADCLSGALDLTQLLMDGDVCFSNNRAELLWALLVAPPYPKDDRGYRGVLQYGEGACDELLAARAALHTEDCEDEDSCPKCVKGHCAYCGDEPFTKKPTKKEEQPCTCGLPSVHNKFYHKVLYCPVCHGSWNGKVAREDDDG